MLAALALGGFAGLLHLLFALQSPPGHHSDFGQIWFGARALLSGENPYALIGPGRAFDWQWPLYYPATALVLAFPFTALSEHLASAAFIGVSSAVLAYVVTADGWYRLPMFGSVAFLNAVTAAQWSPLLATLLLLPGMGWLAVAKPTYLLPWLATVPRRRPLIAVAAVAFAVFAVSIVILPGWPVDWWTATSGTKQVTVPIIHVLGVPLLLTLLRWRRREARVLLALACMPQTFFWYETLAVFLVPRNLRQMLYLVLFAGVGYVSHDALLRVGAVSGSQGVHTLLLLSVYLPALFLILARPNEADNGWPFRRSRGDL